jgi:hypothetical protein
VTSPAHGLSTGQIIALVNVGGNLAAKGVWTITVIDANSFSLNSSVGSGAFTRGGEWYPALSDFAGQAFSGTPPAVTIPGSLGLIQSTGYVLVCNITGSNRDHWQSLHYVFSADNSV